MPQTTTFKEKFVEMLPGIGLAVLVVACITTVGVLFFSRGQKIVEDQLKDKLKSTATAAALQFDGALIERIREGDSIKNSAALRDVVGRLLEIKNSVSNVKYAYIMRRTDSATEHEFVADADLGVTDTELDENKNGIVEDDEAASQPGELYDWTAFPALGEEAFLRPTVDEHIGQDRWGPIISGYAPIRTKQGKVVAILGIDMSADEYINISRSIFSPVATLLVSLAVLAISAGLVIYTWQRRMEILNRLEVERSGLLRLAFHQLGGPLTIINWAIEELEDEGPASIQRTITNIQEGVKRLTGILKMLKDADLVHAGKVEYKAEMTSLSETIRHTAKQLGAKLAQKNQTISLDLEENITMALDPKLIGGVAQEIITNAIDFSPVHSQILLRSKRVGHFAEFQVSDKGCGIPKKDLGRVFGEFTRGSNATKFKADGNGLGLYIVKGIVDRAGGRIIIESEEGTGTTVTVRLPMR